MNEEQYKLTCARRTAFHHLIWQTPLLATIAQAFLLAPAFNPFIGRATALVLACFSLLVGLASLQLMAKHRYLERRDCELLRRFEQENAGKDYEVIHGPPVPLDGVPLNWLARLSSVRLWTLVLAGFCALALYAAWSAYTRPEEPQRAVAAPPTQPAPKPVIERRIEVSPAKKE